MESWLPLADLLLGAVVKSVPPPKAPPHDSVFYAARCLKTADGSSIAIGREVPRQSVAPNIDSVALVENSSEWFLNGPIAVGLSSVNVSKGTLRGIQLDSSPEDSAFTIDL
mmetsp:Transcript_36184/g.66536  ORF Transcript_36184/g.66536 Transcript_36184/m.66536 type:complete len:111 (+) Transcript_36184:1637-1969(+)